MYIYILYTLYTIICNVYISYTHIHIDIMHLFSLPMVLSIIIISHLNYCSSLLTGVLSLGLHPCLPAICQTESNTSVFFLRNEANHVTPLLKIFQWFPTQLRWEKSDQSSDYGLQGPEGVGLCIPLWLYLCLSSPVSLMHPQVSSMQCIPASGPWHLLSHSSPKYPHGLLPHFLQVC